VNPPTHLAIQYQHRGPDALFAPPSQRQSTLGESTPIRLGTRTVQRWEPCEPGILGNVEQPTHIIPDKRRLPDLKSYPISKLARQAIRCERCWLPYHKPLAVLEGWKRAHLRFEQFEQRKAYKCRRTGKKPIWKSWSLKSWSAGEQCGVLGPASMTISTLLNYGLHSCNNSDCPRVCLSFVSLAHEDFS